MWQVVKKYILFNNINITSSIYYYYSISRIYNLTENSFFSYKHPKCYIIILNYYDWPKREKNSNMIRTFYRLRIIPTFLFFNIYILDR